VAGEIAPGLGTSVAVVNSAVDTVGVIGLSVDGTVVVEDAVSFDAQPINKSVITTRYGTVLNAVLLSFIAGIPLAINGFEA
jgi:hypothetical protein